MRVTLAFGPLRYALSLGDGAALPDHVARWRCDDDDAGARRVEVAVVDALPDARSEGAFEATGCVARREADVDRVWVKADGPWRWTAALAALVAHDAPSRGCVVMHGAALRVEGGVALVMAPGGTGKSTLAETFAARSFAHNATLVAPDAPGGPTARALPFAGDARPHLDDPSTEARVRALCLLERAEAPGFEWLPGSAATGRVVKACARAPLPDPAARERAMIVLSLAARVPAGLLRSTRGRDDLAPLDHALALPEPLCP